MDKKQWGIYQIKNIKNNKVYIGSSVNLLKRLYEHKRLLRIHKHFNKHLQNSWDKYGEDAFEFTILELVDKSYTNKQLREIETEYILKFKSHVNEYGYNFIPGGIGTLNLVFSEERRRKISQKNKGRVAYNKGIPMPDAQRIKLKQTRREKYGKAVDIYSPVGDYIETLGSVHEVMEKYQLPKSAIMNQCNGKKSGKGMFFRYHDQPLKNNVSYIKNFTYGNNIFFIYDLNGVLIHRCRYKKEVVKFCLGTSKKNKKLYLLLHSCINSNKPKLIMDKYIIWFKDALNNSNIVNVSRQLGLDASEGISNDANGEA